MNQQPYGVSMKEIHHIHKLDAPSGTAITLAEGIAGENPEITGWSLAPELKEGKVPILSERTGEVPGTHVVTYKSDVDTIEISHEAHSRKGFALGAVVSAEWIVGRRGVFGMDDLLEHLN